MYLPPQSFLKGTSDLEFRSGKMCPVFTFSDIPGILIFVATAKFISHRLEGML